MLLKSQALLLLLPLLPIALSLPQAPSQPVPTTSSITTTDSTDVSIGQSSIASVSVSASAGSDGSLGTSYGISDCVLSCSRQSTAGIPACLTPLSFQARDCACGQFEFQERSRDCLAANCTAADTQKAVSLQLALCGTTEPLTADQAPSSSSSSRAVSATEPAELASNNKNSASTMPKGGSAVVILGMLLPFVL